MEGTKAIQKFLPSRGHETFVFVHGAWHGTWCWERVETLLQALGHKTVAVDLPAHGKAGGDIAAQNLDTYVDCVVAELDRHSEPVILAGHSMAGVIISMAAEKRPERFLVPLTETVDQVFFVQGVSPPLWDYTRF